jgi:hypothetical protein
LIVLVAVALRAAVIARGWGTLDDPDNYLPMARSLASGEGFAFNGKPTAYRPPLYPLILALLLEGLGDRVLLGTALLHLVLGAATVWLTAAAAIRFGATQRRAMIAALVTACDPVLVWQSRSVMTETASAFLVALALAGLSWNGLRGAIMGGLAFGLAALCRPSILAPAGATVLGSLAAVPGRMRERLVRTSAIGLATVLVLLPWMIRNLQVLGEPVWTTTHGGYTLALANNPVYYRDVLNGPPGRVWTGDEQWRWFDGVNRATVGMTEPQADRYLTGTVWRLAREKPGDFIRAAWARLGRFWSLVPAGSVYGGLAQWAAAAWTLPLWIGLVLGLLRRSLWRWAQVAAPSIVIGLTLVHTLYWTDLRMRAPIVPAIALIVCGAQWPFGRSGADRGT